MTKQIQKPRDMKQLKYGTDPQETAQYAYNSESEGATIRVDDEKNLQEGDALSMETPSGDEFGTALVTHVVEVFAHQAYSVVSERGAEYGAESSEMVMSLLNHYYDDTIWPSTRVKIIFYEVKSYVGD